MLNNNQVELSENNLIVLFYEFFKCVYRAIEYSIFLDFVMQLLKDDTVKQHGNHPSGTWGDAEQ